ncbi:MAG: 50S ribosomal protein L29 [Parcubacteria group bacterium GW2011_GWA2_47_26]|nr:MAG: 50S ribosomal protein L29 [Parcubacteria group bacterium GW2011_GWA2_47_26]
MTIKELRQLNEVEQGKILQESRKKLRELRFKAARREVKNVRDMRETKKTIARILTLISK